MPIDDGVDRPGKTAPDKLAPKVFLTRNPGLVGSNFIIRGLCNGATGGADERFLPQKTWTLASDLSLHGRLINGCPKGLCGIMNTTDPN